MNSKKTLILAMLLTALAAIYFASERLAAKKAQRPEVTLAAGFDKGRAAAITIKSPAKDAVVLKKQAGSWTATSGKKTYAADASAITALLGQIGNMKSGTMVSKNSKNFDAFEVSAGKAVDVKIEDAAGRVLAWVLLGKNGPDIFSTYVRAHDAQTVYLVPGFLKNAADQELNGWRDKLLFKLDTDKITLFSVSGDKDLDLRKTTAGAWQAVCGGRVLDIPTEAAKRIISGFAALSAADFSEDSMAQAKLDKPVRTITASLSDGSQRTLSLGGDKNAFQQFVKTGGVEQIYVVEKAQLDGLAPSCEDLKNSGKAPDTAKAPAAVKQ